MRKLCISLVIGVLAAMFSTSAFGQCSEKLIQSDVVSARSDVWYKAHVATVFTREQFEQKSRDLLATGESFLFSYEDAQEAKSRVEEKLDRSLEFNESTAYFQMTANKDSLDAYVECMRVTPTNDYLGLTVSGRPDDTEFLITLFWKPSITNAGKLSNVKPQIVGGKLLTNMPSELKAGHTTFIVSRPKADKALKLAVNGTKGPGAFSDSLSIPPYIKLPVVDEVRFPVFVDHRMIYGCRTRGDRCSWEDATTVLGGQLHTNGVVFTQTWGQNSTAIASFKVVKGAGKFIYTVGNYWTGGNCGGQQNMRAVIYVDGARKWEGIVDRVHSGALDISANAKEIELRGESVDQDVRCDDMAWGSLRFEK